MKYKPKEHMAMAIGFFIERMSHSDKVDTCIIEREALSLNHEAISLTQAKSLCFFKEEGLFNEALLTDNPAIFFDKARLLGFELLQAQEHFTSLQKLIIDSVIFSVAIRVQESPEYNKLIINLPHINAEDEALFTLLNHDFNTHFRNLFLIELLDFIEFKNESLTVRSIDKLKKHKSKLIDLSFLDEGLEVPEAFLKQKTRILPLPYFAEKLLSKHQEDMRKALREAGPQQVMKSREYKAKRALLTIRQALLDIFLKGRWPLTWLVNLPLLQAEEDNSYLWLPAPIAHLFIEIDKAFILGSAEDTSFQEASKKVNESIRTYQPSFWSNPQTNAFFQNQKERLSGYAALEDVSSSPGFY